MSCCFLNTAQMFLKIQLFRSLISLKILLTGKFITFTKSLLTKRVLGLLSNFSEFLTKVQKAFVDVENNH